MGQGLSSVNNDHSDDDPDGGQIPLSADDRASQSLRTPDFQLPRQDDSVAAEAERTPGDDSVPKAAAQPADLNPPASDTAASDSTDSGVDAGTTQSTPGPPRDSSFPKPAQSLVAPADDGAATSPASLQASDAGDATSSGQAVARRPENHSPAEEMNPADSASDDTNPDAPDPVDAGALSPSDSSSTSGGLTQRRADFFQYLQRNGVQTGAGPDGTPRVQTDGQGNPQWQPADPAPYQDEDMRWLRNSRDEAGRPHETDLIASGQYKVNPQTGDRYTVGDDGIITPLGKDEPTVHRLQIQAARDQMATQDAADWQAILQLRADAQPVYARYKELQAGAINGHSVAETENVLQTFAGQPDQLPQEWGTYSDLLSTYRQWVAVHSEYATVQKALGGVMDEVRTRQLAMQDRHDASLALGVVPLGTSVGALLPPTYQDSASLDMPHGQTSGEHMLLVAGSQAAANGTPVVAELAPALQKLRDDGIIAIGTNDIEAVMRTADVARGQLQVKAVPAGGFFAAAKDFGIRVFGTCAADINKAFEGLSGWVAPLTESLEKSSNPLVRFAAATSPIVWLGKPEMRQFFKDNAATAANMGQDHARDGTLEAQIASAAGHILAATPATALAAVTLPETIGAGAVGLLAKAGQIAWNAIPIATQFAAAASAEAHDVALEKGLSADQANAEGAGAALGTLKALPLYLLGGGAAGALEKPVLGLLVRNPALANTFLRGAVNFVLNTAANTAVSGALRKAEGGNFLPTREEFIGDTMWAAQGAIHAALEQRERLQALPVAKSIVSGADPTISALVRAGGDQILPEHVRRTALVTAAVLHGNATDFLRDMGVLPRESAASAGNGSAGSASDAMSPKPAPGAAAYGDGLDRAKEIHGRYEQAAAQSDEVGKAAAIDELHAQHTRLGGMAQERFDGLNDAERLRLGKVVNSGIDVPGVEARLRSNPELGFAAQELGQMVRGAYVDPIREPHIRAAIAATGERAGAAAKLVDRHVGMLAARDLQGLVGGESVPELRARALQQSGLVEVVPDGRGRTVLTPTSESLQFLPAPMRQALVTGRGKGIFKVASGTPQGLFAVLAEGGRQRAAEMFHETPKPPEEMRHDVQVAFTPKDEKVPVTRPMALKAAGEFEAKARAAARVQHYGHEVHEVRMKGEETPAVRDSVTRADASATGAATDRPSPRDYTLEAMKVMRDQRLGRDLAERAPTAEERQRIVDAYREQVRKSGSSSVPIADVMESAGFHLSEVPEAKQLLRGIRESGEISGFPDSDWSAAENRERAWGLPGIEEEMPVTRMEMRDEPREEVRAEESQKPDVNSHIERPVSRLPEHMPEGLEGFDGGKNRLDADAGSDLVGSEAKDRAHSNGAGSGGVGKTEGAASVANPRESGDAQDVYNSEGGGDEREGDHPGEGFESTEAMSGASNPASPSPNPGNHTGQPANSAKPSRLQKLIAAVQQGAKKWLTAKPKTFDEVLKRLGLHEKSKWTEDDVRHILQSLKKKGAVQTKEKVLHFGGNALDTNPNSAGLFTEKAIRGEMQKVMDLLPPEIARKLRDIAVDVVYDKYSDKLGAYENGRITLNRFQLGSLPPERIVRTIWHETMHWIHLEGPPEYRAMIKRHFGVRTAGEKIAQLPGYQTGCEGLKDHWYDSYAGRVYKNKPGGDEGVEVPTTYFELFADPSALARITNQKQRRNALYFLETIKIVMSAFI